MAAGLTTSHFEGGLDAEKLRARLRRMTESELLDWGSAAAYMCSPAANLGDPPRPAFVQQLEEARAEWLRRKGEGSARPAGKPVPDPAVGS